MYFQMTYSKDRPLSIGVLAEETGCKVPTIRYYEKIGLMPAPIRTEGNQRRYGPAHVGRLGFIRHARELGFPLDRIREILALGDKPERSCAEVDRIARDQLAAVEARIARLTNAVIGYMRIKTLTSLGTAICVWALLRWMGVDFAVLWALLAFFFNFIPVIGNILMMIPAVLLALVQAGLGTAAAVAAGYLVINTVIGNVLEPRIMGKGLGVSTLAVFVSLLFWGWLFGTVGMFLAVPLTVAVVIALDASPHTRPLAIMLGPDIRGIDSKGGIRDDASQEKPSPPGSDSTR